MNLFISLTYELSVSINFAYDNIINQYYPKIELRDILFTLKRLQVSHTLEREWNAICFIKVVSDLFKTKLSFKTGGILLVIT